MTAVDARWRQAAYARSCCIQRVTYTPNDRTCWYNKTNSNTNSNFTNEVRILEKKEFNIPSTVSGSVKAIQYTRHKLTLNLLTV